MQSLIFKVPYLTGTALTPPVSGMPHAGVFNSQPKGLDIRSCGYYVISMEILEKFELIGSRWNSGDR
jgi:hypothetical protein